LANRVIFRDFFKPELIGKIFDLKNHHNYDIEKTLYLFDELDFKQILILFVLDYIFDFIDDKQYTNCKSFTFCFDNLDELRFEYITPKMWSAILDLSSNMRYIIQNTDLNFDYRKVIFILVFREANIACGIAALNDRLSPEVRNKRFIFTTIAKEIIGRRINLVTRYLDENDKRLKFLLETIKEERILDYILMPLFNYDYRKLCEAAVDCIQPEHIDGNEYRLFTALEDDYSQIPVTYKYLRRGILLNTFIRYFAKANYLEKLAPIRRGWPRDRGYCNTTRLMLTVFSNLSFPNGFPETIKELAEVKPIPFTLYAAYKECERFLLTPTNFFDHLKKLIDLDKSSWAHLVTIYGKQPRREFDSYIFDFTDEILLLNKKIKKENLSDKESDYLNSLAISLNSSAYIYLRHILPHFEYISGYKTKENGISWYSLRPLIHQTDIVVSEKIILWQFECQIKAVYEIVELYTCNNFTYYEEIFSENEPDKSKKDFCLSKFVFKGEYIKEHQVPSEIERPNRMFNFFSTRIVTTHIGYLENFRHYITNEGFEILEKKIKQADKAKPSIDNRGKIHEFIL
jgi:hypothetical protein